MYLKLVQFDAVKLRHGVDQIRRGDRLGHAVLPATAFDEIIEEHSDYVIWLQESSVPIHNTEAVGVAVGRNADLGSGLAHLFSQVFEQVIVGFRGVSAEQNVATVVHRGHLQPGTAKQFVRVSASRARHGIEDYAQVRFANRAEVDDFTQTFQVGRLGIERSVLHRS